MKVFYDASGVELFFQSWCSPKYSLRPIKRDVLHLDTLTKEKEKKTFYTPLFSLLSSVFPLLSHSLSIPSRSSTRLHLSVWGLLTLPALTDGLITWREGLSQRRGTQMSTLCAPRSPGRHGT